MAPKQKPTTTQTACAAGTTTIRRIGSVVFTIDDRGRVSTPDCGDLGTLEECEEIADTLNALFTMNGNSQKDLIESQQSLSNRPAGPEPVLSTPVGTVLVGSAPSDEANPLAFSIS